MRNILKLFLIASVLGLVAAFAAPPILLRSSPADQLITQEIRKMTGAVIESGQAQFSYFPFLTARFKDVRIRIEGPRPWVFEAAELRIRLARIPFLIGKLEIAGIHLSRVACGIPIPDKDGSVLETVRVHDAAFRTGPLKAEKPIKAFFAGSINGIPGVLSARAVLRVKSLEKLEWTGTSLDAAVNLQDIPIKLLEKSLDRYLRSEIIQGTFGGQWTFRKEPGGDVVKAHAEGNARGFSYRFRQNPVENLPPAVDLGFRYQIHWNPVTNTMNVQSATLTTPIGRVEVSGNLLGAEEGLQDVRVTASEIVLESIPQYFSALKDAIPYNIGFSGLSRLEMSISGSRDLLSVNAKLDLTQALLTYARYFSKPKDLPFDVVFDYEFQHGKILNGDFSIRFKDMTMKGSLTDLDLMSGAGQLNVITNKFQIKDWEKFIPVFEGYKLDGQMKALANFKGNLQKLYETKPMFNITLEKGRVAGPRGRELTEITTSLDLSPLGLEVRGTSFKSGEDSVTGSFRAYNLLVNPVTQLSLKADQVDVSRLAETLDDLARPWLAESLRAAWDEGRASLAYLFPSGENWKKMTLEWTRESGAWQVPVLNFDAYQGSVNAQGEGVSFGEDQGGRWDIKADRLSLALYGKRGGRKEGPVEGNLFLESHLRIPAGGTEPWLDRLEGEGLFLITNGDLRTLSLMGALTAVPDFSEVFKAPSGDSTLFNDLQAEYRISGRRITADKMMLLGEGFQADGGGSLTFDGAVNGRLQVYLDPRQMALDPTALSESLKEEGMIGPVALLVSGEFSKPDVKLDPAQIPQIFKQLLASKRYRALDNFLSEDFFKASASN